MSAVGPGFLGSIDECYYYCWVVIMVWVCMFGCLVQDHDDKTKKPS